MSYLLCFNYFKEIILNQIDDNTKMMLYVNALKSWMQFYITMPTLIFLTICLLVTCYSFINGMFTNTSMFGMILLYSITMLEILPYAVICYAKTQSIMVHVERMNQYTNIETENTKRMDITKHVINRGKIIFKNVNVKYRNYLENFALKNVNIEINDGEKVCIIGRTGSGKSTFFNTLLRLIKLEN
eukprot:261193_1